MKLILNFIANRRENWSDEKQFLSLELLVVILVFLVVMWTDAKASVIYTDRAAFEATQTDWIIDDYQDPRYTAGDMRDDVFLDRFSDARMTEISGTTRYRTTIQADVNAIARYMELNDDLTPNLDRFYCGGCNASFELSWDGINAVGIDIGSNYSFGPFWASVLYSDGSLEDWELPIEERARVTHTFWGITSLVDITSIHFGQPGATPYLGGSFSIDNLTIASNQVSAVPAPAALWLFLTGLVFLFMRRRYAR